MRINATISGSELLLSVIAIRLAVLVVVAFGLTLLPRQARNDALACNATVAAASEARPPAGITGPRIVDAAFADMLQHD
ncbi:hypothetical protein JQ599_10235 [Bradyrhizobium diazoefficiens]|jgi:hypothetical protein|nr:hypothetical protein [Bradyrhizobium diazoefficiens]MBR0700276.1 hypothetical protein [Bradyrhizobium diazoefficiens]MBR0768701.1 hypothetical protein [Bradyrhizobium diazoefficiens]